MRAITYAHGGHAAGCHATILGVSRMNMPGQPSTAVAIVPVGSNKCFDVYIYTGSEGQSVDHERRIAHGVQLADAIQLALGDRGDLDDYAAV